MDINAMAVANTGARAVFRHGARVRRGNMSAAALGWGQDGRAGNERVAVIALNHAGEVLAHAESVATDGGAEYALMVLPERRGVDIDRRLLAALQELAVAAGQRQRHGIIQAGNTPAIQLALKLGFRGRRSDDRDNLA